MTMQNAITPGSKIKPMVLILPPKVSKNPESVNAFGNGPSTHIATVKRVKNIVGESQKMVAAGLFNPIVRRSTAGFCRCVGAPWP